MKHRLPIAALILLIPFTTVPAAIAGIGGPYGEVSLAYEGSETLTLMVVPDRSGPAFTQARLPWGQIEDATITLRLLSAAYDPIEGFPREDMWLESRDGGLALCQGGTIADSNTDANGLATWSRPPAAGGHSEAMTDVLVNGSVPELATGVRVSYNSPDINGDLVVNLTDVQMFSADFYAAYAFRSDFYRDGTLNLSDIVPLSRAAGAVCP
jgi:hypothetical protein